MSRADEWRAASAAAAEGETVELPLPSGMVILARRPDPLQLAAWNQLPLHLVAAVAPAAGEVTDEMVLGVMRGAREILEYCCVDPRISLGGEAGTIHPREICKADWQFIVSWALRTAEAAKMRPFRGERADAGGGADGDGLRAAAIGADGDPGSGAGAGL